MEGEEMIKTICDRCEEEVKEDENELHFTEQRTTRFGYDQRLNLCNSCLAGFWRWMKENTKPSQ